MWSFDLAVAASNAVFHVERAEIDAEQTVETMNSRTTTRRRTAAGLIPTIASRSIMAIWKITVGEGWFNLIEQSGGLNEGLTGNVRENRHGLANLRRCDRWFHRYQN